MYLVRNPSINLAIFEQYSFWTNQTRCVENMTRPLGIDFEHRAALNVDVMFPGFLFKQARVFVWHLDSKLVDQFRCGRKHWRGMRKLGENNQANGQERRRARPRR